MPPPPPLQKTLLNGGVISDYNQWFISEHIGTGGCSDLQNVRICKIMIIIMIIIIDNNVNVFYLLHYLSIK